MEFRSVLSRRVTHELCRGKGYAGECLEFARQIAEKEIITCDKVPQLSLVPDSVFCLHIFVH